MAKASDQRVGIADVARAAGVSKSAVSFAFNSPDRLSAETANRIRVVADRMGYRPHPVARMLSAGQTTTIGILSPQALGQVFANPFFALFAEGVASVTEEVSEVPGVESVDVVLESGAMTVTSTEPLERAVVAAAVTEAGFALT